MLLADSATKADDFHLWLGERVPVVMDVSAMRAYARYYHFHV